MRKFKGNIPEYMYRQNCFILLGYCRDLLEKQNATEEEVDEFIGEAMSSDNENLILTVKKWFK